MFFNELEWERIFVFQLSLSEMNFTSITCRFIDFGMGSLYVFVFFYYVIPIFAMHLIKVRFLKTVSWIFHLITWTLSLAHMICLQLWKVQWLNEGHLRKITVLNLCKPLSCQKISLDLVLCFEFSWITLCIVG